MFTLQSFGLASTSFGQPTQVATDNSALGAPRIYTYYSNVDTASTIGGANYFLALNLTVNVGDLIYVKGSDATVLLTFSTVTSTEVDTTLTVSSTVPSNVLQYVSVPISSAQFLNLDAANVELIPAPGTNKLIIVHNWTLVFIWNSIQYANGGAVRLEYNSFDIPNTGDAASDSIAAASIDSQIANQIFPRGIVTGDYDFDTATAVNKAIMLAKQGVPFINGNSSFIVNVWYSIISTV